MIIVLEILRLVNFRYKNSIFKIYLSKYIKYKLYKKYKYMNLHKNYRSTDQHHRMLRQWIILRNFAK